MTHHSDIEEEIARALHAGIVKAAREDCISIEVFDETPGFDFELDLAKSLAPLLNRVRAEALREARDNVRASSFWADGSDNYADRVRGYLSNAADRIEQNRGNET